MPIKPEELAQNTEALLKEFGLEHASQSSQMIFVQRLGENIYKRILIVVAERLSVEKLHELEALMNQENNREAIEQFLKAEIPDFERIVQEESRAEIEETKKLIKKGE